MENSIDRLPTDLDIEKASKVMDSLKPDDVIPSLYKSYVQDISNYKLLSLEEEMELTKKYQETKDINIRNQLANHNLRLVISIAKHYVRTGVEFEDLISEGNVGLIRGIETFDPSRGFRLSTYCVWWIRQAITRYISNCSRSIRLPVHVNERIGRIKKFIRMYMEEYGELPTDEEIKESVGIDDSTLDTFKTYSNDILSLDIYVSKDGDEDTTYGDFVPSEEKTPEEVAIYSDLRETLGELLDNLPEKESTVLKYRFGFMDGNCWTLEEVSKLYGVTRERIRQIEGKGLKKLRHPKWARLLRDYRDLTKRR